MKNAKHIFIFLIFTAAVMPAFVSCSSAPKNPGDVVQLRTTAESQLDAGNREAGQGRYENALVLITESKRNAILADDPSLIVRTSLSRGNVLFATDRADEAFAEWELAVAEAQRSNNGELLSASKIYLARGNLFSERASAQSVLDEVNREAVNIKTLRQYIAFSWQVKGLALRALGRYNEAEDALKQSLAINEKDRYLENASYDWYTIASIRSLAGNTDGALEALNTSITIDRRIENSWGLAASWRATGDVYRKTGNAGQAAEAYRRARELYTAMGNDAEVSETERRMAN
jgi:tetratricopeptide (TPR) repeat protein